MNWKAVLCALCVSVSVAGCGGGGGGGGDDRGFVPPPSSDPISEVKALDAQLGVAVNARDINLTMGFYSERYFDAQGNTKADVRAIFQAIFQYFDVVSSTEVVELATIQPNGTVTLGVGGNLTIRDRRDGSISTLSVAGTNFWAREGSTWRIIENRSQLLNGMKKALVRNL